MLIHFLLFGIILFFTNAQDPIEPVEIFFDTPVKDDLKEGYVEYYKLMIPDGIEKSTKNLIIRVKENDEADEGKDDFSDPDVYVSKLVKLPEDPRTSTWYSERYGEDILLIPNDQVYSKEVFYIGVYCERKCKFELLASLNVDNTLEEGTMTNVLIPKESSVTYKFKTKKNYTEFEIISFAPKLGQYRLYVTKDGSSSRLNVIPTWLGGYTVSISKDSADYCEECYFNILIEAENTEVEVYLLGFYEDTVNAIRPTEPMFSVLKQGGAHCYSFELTKLDVMENLIIQTSLFSGSAMLKISGWNQETDITKDFTDEHAIYSEKFLIITPEDRKRFPNSKDEGNFYFCLGSTEPTSYVLKAYLGSQTQDLQRFNFLKKDVPMKGYLPSSEITKYRMIDFTRDSNITVSMETIKGKPFIYGYICDNMRKCFFTSEKLIKELTDGNMIQPNEVGLQSELSIPNTINTCHQKINQGISSGDSSLEVEYKSIPCSAIVVVTCEGADDCLYRLTFTHDTSTIELKPRQTYYQMIPYNETDYFKFTIPDDTVENIVIVLNAISGDVDLLVYSEDPLKPTSSNNLIDSSFNAMYVPDVVKINKEKINKTTLKGVYYIAVKSDAFSTYSLYYYTYDTPKEDVPPKPDYSDVGMELQTGHIIKDFFDVDTKYKIYIYNPQIQQGMNNLDIRITVTPESSQYSIYVFTDLNKLVYDPKAFEVIGGSQWRSDWSNEVIISKNDPNYIPNGDYFIVLIKRYEDTNTHHFPSYYIGVTNEFYPFLLFEGMPNLITLDNNFNSQSYWYTHSNVSEAMSVSLNLFYGRVNVYIDFKEIRNLNATNVAYSELNVDKSFITLQPELLKLKCGQQSNCGVYILIVKSTPTDAQYLLTVKSNLDKEELLLSGVVKTDTLLTGEYKYYYTSNLNKTSDSIISVSFTSGIGNVYAKFIKNDELLKETWFPNATNYDYKGSDYYVGRIIYIKQDALKDCVKCKLLISVLANDLGFSSNSIEYAISYYSEGRRINQNQPYRGSIKQGEMQFFSFYFGKKIDNVYFTLTNTDGDADLYLNHGSTFPTFGNSTWYSNLPHHQFIEITKEDAYFISNGLTDVSGDYTLMIYGNTDVSYTLFATDHPNKIVVVSDGSPVSCKCKSTTDTCLFRFDTVMAQYNEIILDTDLIITTNYLYGAGKIHAKLIKQQTYLIEKDFPTSSNFDYSTTVTNTRNILNVHIPKENPNLTTGSVLLVSVECMAPSFFDLNIARMSDSEVKYIDMSRENVFFLKKSDYPTLLIYYSSQAKDLNFEVSAYTGSANFLVYMNETNWNNEKQAYNSNYEHVAVFDLQYPENDSYHNSIKSNPARTYQNIYFKVTPKTDVGFYVRVNYDQEWTKININKMNTYMLNKQVFHGYFDMLEEYSDAILTVQTDDVLIMAKVFVKMNLYDKTKKGDKKDFGFSLPDLNNFDYFGSTNAMLSSVSLQLPGLSKEERGDKYVRYMFKVETWNAVFTEKDTKINVIVQPNVSNVSRIQAEQGYYYFAKGEKKSEVMTLFDLQRGMKSDDLLVVELSSCKGDTKYSISDKLTFFDEQTNLVQNTPINSNGKKLLLISPLDAENYYLSVTAINSQSQICLDDNLPSSSASSCGDPEYMMYYFTTTSAEYRESFFNMSSALEYERVDDGEVLVKMPKIIAKNDNGVVSKQKKLAFQTYISEKIEDYNYMESVCYLTAMNPYTSDFDLKYDEQDNTMSIKNLKPDTKYYVNVLVRNIETRELLAYRPIEIIVTLGGISTTGKVFIAGIIIVLILVSYFFYRKFKVTKQILDYEVNDIRNLTNVPKSTAEMKSIINEKNAQKYSSLTEDTGKV